VAQDESGALKYSSEERNPGVPGWHPQAAGWGRLGAKPAAPAEINRDWLHRTAMQLSHWSMEPFPWFSPEATDLRAVIWTR
jgi:hypothetical protein